MVVAQEKYSEEKRNWQASSQQRERTCQSSLRDPRVPAEHRRALIGGQFLEHHLYIDAPRVIDQAHHDIDRNAHQHKDQSHTNAAGV